MSISQERQAGAPEGGIEITPEMEAAAEEIFYDWLLDNRETVIEYVGQPDIALLLRRFHGVAVGL